jgi:hypothetical protein
MACEHEGLRDISTSYDRDRGLLVYYWTCEGCGERLEDTRLEEYRPRFDPRGNDAYLRDVQAA